MCNLLHEDSRSIPKTGFGYKVVGVYVRDRKIVYRNWNSSSDLRKLNKHRYLKWDKNYLDTYDGKGPHNKTTTRFGDGFCFFLTKADAILSLGWYFQGMNTKYKLVRIKYRRGLGAHVDDLMPGSEIAIATEYRLAKKGEGE